MVFKSAAATIVEATKTVIADPRESSVTRSGDPLRSRFATASLSAKRPSSEARSAIRCATLRIMRTTISRNASSSKAMATNPRPKSGRGSASSTRMMSPAAETAVRLHQIAGIATAAASTPRNSAAGVTDRARPSAGSAKVNAVSTPNSQADPSGEMRRTASGASGRRSAVITVPVKASPPPAITPARLADPPRIRIWKRYTDASLDSRRPSERSMAIVASFESR